MIYVDNLNELPKCCYDCKFRGLQAWTCRFVWNGLKPFTLCSQKEYYEENWKHPDCPLRKVKEIFEDGKKRFELIEE